MFDLTSSVIALINQLITKCSIDLRTWNVCCYDCKGLLCSVSDKITKTTQWSHGHTSVFRLLCTRPRVQGRMAPMFPPALSGQRRANLIRDGFQFLHSQILELSTSPPNQCFILILPGALGEMDAYFLLCHPYKWLQHQVALAFLDMFALPSSRTGGTRPTTPSGHGDKALPLLFTKWKLAIFDLKFQ